MPGINPPVSFVDCCISVQRQSTITGPDLCLARLHELCT